MTKINYGPLRGGPISAFTLMDPEKSLSLRALPIRHLAMGMQGCWTIDMNLDGPSRPTLVAARRGAAKTNMAWSLSSRCRIADPETLLLFYSQSPILRSAPAY